MIQVKNMVSKKDRREIQTILYELIDYNRDFYITKDNIRLFIKDNFDVLIKDLRKGDVIGWSENAVGVIVGFADKTKRKYLKILYKNVYEAKKLLKVMLIWKFPNLGVYMKAKKTNRILNVLMKEFGFKKIGDRGSEVLLFRSRPNG